jgi:hypothetical protein
MAVHTELSPTEAADRLALRELFDGYAHCAKGESYTIAHHVFTEDGDRKIMIASLRYLDTFAKTDGRWVFADGGSSSTGARRDHSARGARSGQG